MRLGEWEGSLLAALQTAWGLPELHIFSRTGSTNDVARELAEAGAPAGTTVLAETQTAGRGRSARAWLDLPGYSLLLSMVLRPGNGSEAPCWGALPLRAGLVTAHAIDAVTGLEVCLKWPNDLEYPVGRKIAGVLCEAAHTRDSGFAVVGIGINVRQRPEDFPEELRARAGSLRSALRHDPDRASVAQAVVAGLLPLATSPVSCLDEAELREFTRRDPLRGLEIYATGRRLGRSLGISADGSLRVLAPHGAVLLHRSGAVRALQRSSVARS